MSGTSSSGFFFDAAAWVAATDGSGSSTRTCSAWSPRRPATMPNSTRWPGLRSRFPVRANFGQWLRWEAALEEIRAYYSVPDDFRRIALETFGNGVEQIIASSPSLRLLPPQPRPPGEGVDDDELAERTIFPFVIEQIDRVLSLEHYKKLYRALARGVNVLDGRITYEAVAEAHDLEYTPLDDVLPLSPV